VFSPVLHFRTGVGRAQPFTFLAYGDNRTNSETHAQLVELMLETADAEDARFFLNTGDLTTHASWWDEWQEEFFQPALPMMAYYPLYAVLGNHEGNHESWYSYLALPNNESWYEFSYGDVDFFGLNTSADFAVGSAQYTWLEQALADSDAAWKIAFFHHPPFACTPVRKPGHLVGQEVLVPLFESAGVDLVLSGHDHLYGRSVPIGGTTYVITGGGGAATYPAEPDEINPICIQMHHFCLIRVGPTELTLTAIAIDGEVLDSFTLTH
jgi:3',5'-cyclic AMP phosphodiesterase CpdA